MTHERRRDRRGRPAPVRPVRRTHRHRHGCRGRASGARRRRRRRRGGVQAAFCGTAYGGVAAGHRVLGALGPHRRADRRRRGRAAPRAAAALQLGAEAIAAGQYDCVLVFGIEKMPKGIIRSSFFEPWQEAAGLNAAPRRSSRCGRSGCCARPGSPRTTSPRLVVKNRGTGCAQPGRDVPQGRSPPSRCSPRGWSASRCTSGCCARPTRARRRSCCGGRRRAASRPAFGSSRVALRSHLPGNVLGEDSPLCGIDDDAHHAADHARGHGRLRRRPASAPTTSTWSSARTPTPPASSWPSELGLCARASRAALLADGVVDARRPRPVNPSGGLLSKGEPLGASALGQVVELVRQLRGDAGARQVERRPGRAGPHHRPRRERVRGHPRPLTRPPGGRSRPEM